MLSNEFELIKAINWGILISISLVGFILLGVSYLQFKHYYESKSQKRYKKFLESYFNHSLKSNLVHEITIKENQYFYFLPYWNHLYNRADEETKARLKIIALKSKVAHLCIHLLDKKFNLFSFQQTKQTCILIHTLGNIFENRETPSVEVLLEPLVSSNQDIIAFEASIALLKIDRDKYCHRIMAQIIKRTNWNNKELKHLIHFFDTPSSIELVTGLIERSPRTPLEKRVMQIASTTSYFGQYSKHIIENKDKYSLDSVCLAIKYLPNSEQFYLVEPFKKNKEWFVHVNIIQSITSLNNFTKENYEYLVEKLSDANWWVRTRSAQSIIQYYGSNYEGIDILISTLESKDKFAKDSIVGAYNQYKIRKTFDF